MLLELLSIKNVSFNFSTTAVKTPLVKGQDLPDFWCRAADKDYYIFFAHPMAQGLHYPLSYGQSFTEKTVKRYVRIKTNKGYKKVCLVFKPYQSVMLKVSGNGAVKPIDISFSPRGVLNKRPE